MPEVNKLKAPFPWFGGKSRVSDIVWSRFGDVPNYVEPFAGSLAVLLGRPTAPRTETVNDLDCYLSNFWRALAADPDGVAAAADWPVNEADLHARHQWLVDQAGFRERMKTDPEFYDVKIAGWWVWGLCSWIGSGWCDSAKYREGGVGRVVSRNLPHLGDAGRGVNRKLPVRQYFEQLSARLRRVRVCCGDWRRVLSLSVTEKHGITGVFLDPPYTDGNMDYSIGGVGGDISTEVREWAIANGENPRLRISLCGYEGEHAMPDSWDCVAWKAKGGYGSQAEGRARENAKRERIWFSPHCLRPPSEPSALLFS